jgi:thiol-disulfide isomerase/thioredoxin
MMRLFVAAKYSFSNMKPFFVIVLMCLHWTVKAQSDTLQVLSFGDFYKTYVEPQPEKTMIINFWATWCPGCIAELPYLDSLQREFKDKAKVLLVNIEGNSRTHKHIQPFLQKHTFDSQVIIIDVVHERQDWMKFVCDAWNGSIPATAVFNKTHGEFFEHMFASYEEFKKAILKFIQ